MYFLNAEQLQTLYAVIDRMVPADDYPSASQAGCADFLLRLISLEHQEEQYRAGLDGLHAEAALLGLKFADLDQEAQDNLLVDLRHHKSKAKWETDPSDFVATLASQTIEGYYSDPDNGGNRGKVSWTMIGFEERN